MAPMRFSPSKKACKLMALISLFNYGICFINKKMVTFFGPIICPNFAVLNLESNKFIKDSLRSSHNEEN